MECPGLQVDLFGHRQGLINHYRNYTNPQARAWTIGFRCAKAAELG
jgi:hypothetical protein